MLINIKNKPCLRSEVKSVNKTALSSWGNEKMIKNKPCAHREVKSASKTAVSSQGNENLYD